MLNVLAFVGCCLIWSSTWLFIKMGLDSFGPISFLAIRFLLAAVPLWLVSRAKGEAQPRGARDFRGLFFLSLGMFSLPYSLVYLGESRLSSGLTAVLFAMQPLWAVVFAHFLLTHERFRAAQMGGMLLGLGGVAVVCLEGIRGRAEWHGAAAILSAALCQGFMAVWVKRSAAHRPPFATLAWSNLFAGLALSPALLLEPHAVGPVDARGWVSLAFLSIFGSAVAFVLVFRLYRVWEATKTSTISLITPPLALLWGSLFLHEPLGAGYVAGVALVLAGVAAAAVVKPKGRSPA